MFKFMKYSKNKTKAFSTLFIVIIIGFIALSITLTLSTSGFWSIQGSINSKNSNQAKSLVNACAEIALENIRENNTYTGTGSLNLNNNVCDYTITNTGGTSRLISVSGTVKDVTRKITITTSTFNPLVISSWQEI